MDKLFRSTFLTDILTKLGLTSQDASKIEIVSIGEPVKISEEVDDDPSDFVLNTKVPVTFTYNGEQHTTEYSYHRLSPKVFIENLGEAKFFDPKSVNEKIRDKDNTFVELTHNTAKAWLETVFKSEQPLVIASHADTTKVFTDLEDVTINIKAEDTEQEATLEFTPFNTDDNPTLKLKKTPDNTSKVKLQDGKLGWSAGSGFKGITSPVVELTLPASVTGLTPALTAKWLEGKANVQARLPKIIGKGVTAVTDGAFDNLGALIRDGESFKNTLDLPALTSIAPNAFSKFIMDLSTGEDSKVHLKTAFPNVPLETWKQPIFKSYYSAIVIKTIEEILPYTKQAGATGVFELDTELSQTIAGGDDLSNPSSTSPTIIFTFNATDLASEPLTLNDSNYEDISKVSSDRFIAFKPEVVKDKVTELTPFITEATTAVMSLYGGATGQDKIKAALEALAGQSFHTINFEERDTPTAIDFDTLKSEAQEITTQYLNINNLSFSGGTPSESDTKLANLNVVKAVIFESLEEYTNDYELIFQNLYPEIQFLSRTGELIRDVKTEQFDPSSPTESTGLNYPPQD